MIKTSDILDEKEKTLRKKSETVTFPLSKKDKNLIEDMLTHLINSQIPEISEKECLRPGMGLSAVQLGVLKRYFVIAHEQDDHTFNKYIIINPKIKTFSEELIYVEDGEGCLSVNREVGGIVPRHARITIEYEDIDGNNKEIRAREELAVAFQHEIDHLNGILFFDHIDSKNPYKDEEKMRMI